MSSPATGLRKKEILNNKNLLKLFFLSLLIALICLTLQNSCSRKSEPADLIILNARIYTVKPIEPWAEAVAIKGEEITSVGKNEEIKRLACKRTQIIDARGRLMLPGFQDSHIHFISGSLNLNRVDLSGTKNLKEIQERIKSFIREHPDLAWIQGRGWMYSAFPGNMPHKKFLDEVVPDKPAIMRCADGHTTWVNSRALALAGIDKNTPDPPNGKIVRDEKGEPTGALLEGAASLVSRLIPEPSQQEIYECLMLGMKEAASYGLTCVHGLGGEWERLELLARLKEEGQLTIRMIITMGIDEPGPKEEDLRKYKEMSTRYNDHWLAVRGVKLMLDGVIDSGTAAMLEPYEGQSEHRGKLFWEPEDFFNTVLALSRRAIQISTHAIGDRAIRLTLDTYERALRESGHSWLRHKIEHVECVAEEDLKRFSHPNIIASFQPLHANPEPVWMAAWIKNVGPEREKRAFPWKSVLKAGGRLAFGSDWPVVTLNPWPGVQVALTRQSLEGYPDGGWIPEEKLTLPEIIEAYTLGGAYALNEEHRRGSIEPGKLADLILLSQNIFEVPISKIQETRSVLTIVGGRIVHRAIE